MMQYIIGLSLGICLSGGAILFTQRGTATLERGQWYCSDARVDSLELPLVVECYEYKRKGVKNDNDK
jgi:hypothetical protein